MNTANAVCGHTAEERDREPPEDEPEPEVGREPLAADERDRRARADDAADADGRVQVADARAALVEQRSEVTTIRTLSAPATSVCAP